MNRQRGGFVMGLVVGLLAGLALALGVALYITKAPVPFLNKVPQRTPEQDSAEAERNRNWDPNGPLASRVPARPVPASAPAAAVLTAPAAAASEPATAAPPAPTRDPSAILAGKSPSAAPGGPESFIYFVQVGAYTRTEEAEQQRARLAMIGYSARVTEREQAGRTVYRVRLGPYESRDEADGVQGRLGESSIEARLVRVERP